MGRVARGFLGGILGVVVFGALAGGAAASFGLWVGALIGAITGSSSDSGGPTEPASHKDDGTVIEQFLAMAAHRGVIDAATHRRLRDFERMRRASGTGLSETRPTAGVRPAPEGVETASDTPTPPSRHVTLARRTPVWLGARLPDSADPPDLIAAEGTRHPIIERRGGFIRIAMPDGRTGWIPSSAVTDRSGRTQPTPPLQARPSAPAPQALATSPTPARRPAAPVTPVRTEPGLADRLREGVRDRLPEGLGAQLRDRLGDLREAVGSDLAVHGFSYLGLALTFAGVFGYMLFSFEELEDQYQPIVEVLIPVVFFGWAWYLRRRQASIVSHVLEVLGGMILPIVVFAGVVDSAPVPPDFQGTTLIVVLVLISLVAAVGYSWWSRNHPGSGLLYLVGPAVWLAALVIGFAFKHDEPLAGPAITRLVPAQGATAAVGIALTLAATRLRAGHRLVRPIMVPAIPSIAIAYALVIGLGAAQGWQNGIPMAVTAAATILSAEVLGRHFDRRTEVRLLQPVLLAAAFVPLGAAWGPEWAGATAALTYLGWSELAVSNRTGFDAAIVLSIIGSIAGAVVAAFDPIAGAVALGVLAAWAHVRRITGWISATTAPALAAAAALLPVAWGWSMLLAVRDDVGWLLFAVIVAAATLAVRLWRSTDRFWGLWLPAVAAGVVTGATATWYSNIPARPAPVLAAVGVASLALAATPITRVVRIWLAGAGAVTAGIIALDAAGASRTETWAVWSIVGAAAVAIALAWHRDEAGHIALIGHGLGTAALIGAIGTGVDEMVLGLATAAWIGSTIAGEAGVASVGALLHDGVVTLLGPGAPRIARALESVPAVMAVSTTPFAVLALLGRWSDFADHRSWSGVALAALSILYAAATRVLRTRRPLAPLLAAGAMVLSLIGVAVAAPVAWPSIGATAATLAVALLLAGDLRRDDFTWFAWVMSGVLVTLLSHQAGVPAERLDTVVVTWGGALLMGSILLDRRWHGAPGPRDGIRSRWLHPPAGVGALALPLALGPVFTEAAGTYGWWSIGAGAAYLAVAALLRIGSAAAPGWALISVGAAVLIGPGPFDPRWLLPAVAAGLVVIGMLFEARQSDAVASDPWLRWDAPPMWIAVIIGTVAMSRAVAVDTVPETWIAFGSLAFLVGLWRRSTTWRDIGNVIVIIGAIVGGPLSGWVALLATAVRTTVEAELSSEARRWIYVGLTPVAAGAAWIETVAWQEWSRVTAAEASAIVFGGLALVVAILHRTSTPLRWTGAWGALATAGTIVAALSVVDAPTGVMVAGMGMFALAVFLAGPIERVARELVAVGAVGAAWLETVAWQGWSPQAVLDLTAVGGGALLLAAVVLGRLHRISVTWVVAWLVLAIVAMTTAWASLGTTDLEGIWTAAGLLLVAGALHLSAPLIGPAARLVPPALVPIAWIAGGVGLNWTTFQASVTTSILFAGIATLAAVAARFTGDADPDEPPPTRIHLIATWLSVAGAVSVLAIPVAGVPELAPVAWGVGAAALLVICVDVASLDRSFGWRPALPGSAVLAVATWTAAGLAIDPSGAVVAGLAVAATVLAAPILLSTSRRAPRWKIPTEVAGLAAAIEAAAIGVDALPDTALLAAAALAAGALIVGIGIVETSPGLVAVGPVLALTSWLLGLAQTDVAGYLWYTIPIGILLLAEVEILRWASRSGNSIVGPEETVILEWAGMAVVAGTPLAHMLVEGVGSTLVVFAAAAGILVWSLLTRVRRRFITALVLAGVAAVMAVAVAAAGGAPSAAFWIMLVGAGTSALMTVGIIDGYRSRSGRIMRRFGEMMEGWE